MPMGAGTQTVSVAVSADIFGKPVRGNGFCLTLRLAWSDADPITVELAVDADPPHPSLPTGTWVVLRDFLRYGLDEPTGDRGVRVRPGPPDRVTLELPRPHRAGPCRVSVSAAAVLAFLDATTAIAPAGRLSETALDALIGQLLQH